MSPIMGIFERFPKPKAAPVEDMPDIEDFSHHPELYASLKRIPEELRLIHLKAIEDLSDEDALGYVQAFLERREAAKTRFHVSDGPLSAEFAGKEAEIRGQLETSVFKGTENRIGEGQTAEVKRFTYQGTGPERRMAVKYLLHPREHTLSVDKEHDLLSEVDQLEHVSRADTAHIRVPHPYFYLRSGRVQCYGMEEVDGVNLRAFREGVYDSTLKDELREAFRGLDRAALDAEIDTFFDAMHEICLHGDIFVDKPGNIMASRDGSFYIIDFGESTHSTTIEEQLDALYKEESEKEKEAARTEIRKFLDALYREERAAA